MNLQVIWGSAISLQISHNLVKQHFSTLYQTCLEKSQDEISLSLKLKSLASVWISPKKASLSKLFKISFFSANIIFELLENLQSCQYEATNLFDQLLAFMPKITQLRRSSQFSASFASFTLQKKDQNSKRQKCKRCCSAQSSTKSKALITASK